jgi:hypothetical protein
METTNSSSLEDFLKDIYHTGEYVDEITKNIQGKIDLIQQICEEWLLSKHHAVEKTLVKVTDRKIT